MNTMTSGHLTDDQFTECVSVAPSAACEAHLLECAQCRQELEQFSASMNDFSMAALAWSEAQPAVSLRAAALKPERHPLIGRLQWAVPAALVLAIGIPVALHGDHSPVAAPEIAQVVPADTMPDDSEAQIAQDNKLMQSVNMALAANEPSPFREYGLQATRRTKAKAGTELRSE